MVTLHSSSKDARFTRVSFVIGPGTATVIAAGAAGLANVIGSMFASKSSNAAARSYLQGVRETNESNLQLAHEQQEWDLAQWNRENEYNSAASQLERWQRAGFSPQSFIQVGDPGNAASLQSPDLANQVAPADMSGYASVNAQNIQRSFGAAGDAALAWREMKLKQDELNLQKQHLANETAGTQAEVTLKSALTKEALKNVDYLKSKIGLTDSERYRVDAEFELAAQRWEQLAKSFELEMKIKSEKYKQEVVETVFRQATVQDEIRRVSAELGKTYRETELLVKQAIYWAWEGKEGEFKYDTQDLRYEILSTQNRQAKFNLKFDEDIRYSQINFERWMAGIDALTKVANTGCNISREIRGWTQPGNWLGNTDTWFDYSDKGKLEHLQRSFTPFPRK